MNWIDIREKDPPYGKDLLVLKDYGLGEGYYCRVEHISSDGRFLCHGSHLITHWMYLPSFPDSGEERLNRFELMDI